MYGSHIRVGKKRKKKIEDNPIDIFTFIDSLSLQKENIYKAMST
jgi:hypothetical protein